MLEPIWRRFPRFFVARRNLTRAKVRSMLAVLTIVIGVFAIATIGNFGMALWESQTQNFASIGNDLQVFPGEDHEGYRLSRADVDQLRRSTGSAEVIPVKQTNRRLTSSGEWISVYGIEDPRRLYEIRRGDVPSNWRKGALVGATLAEQLDVRPGDKIEFRGETYRVAAILARESRGSIARPDNAIVVPPERIEDERYQQVIVRVDSTTEANETATAIREDFNGRKERVRVFERGDIAQSVNQFFTQFNLFLIAVGVVSLVVAGISIANVMLMSVIERREEIGVLRAVGYERLDVLRILLSEAILLGVVGTAFGLTFSVLATMWINSLLLGDPTAFTDTGLAYLGLALAFGIVVSAGGGLYPAWKAARERPVEALRG